MGRRERTAPPGYASARAPPRHRFPDVPSPRVAALSTVVALAVMGIAVSAVLRAGRDLHAPAPLGANWVLAGGSACVGSGALTLSQSGVFLNVTLAEGPLHSLDGRLEGNRFTAHHGPVGAPSGSVVVEGTWTATGLSATVHAPHLLECHGLTLRGTPAPG